MPSRVEQLAQEQARRTGADDHYLGVNLLHRTPSRYATVGAFGSKNPAPLRL